VDFTRQKDFHQPDLVVLEKDFVRQIGHLV
jgi:hypothetical protein